MNTLRSIVRFVLLVAFNLAIATLTVWAATPNPAESTIPSAVLPRVQVPIDDGARVRLIGNTNPLARIGASRAGLLTSATTQSSVDQGVVEDSLPAGRMLLLLQRSAEQEAALRDFIRAAHTPGDPSFHRWLKPAEFGRLYGPADSDVAAVTAWLESHGLTVNQVHSGRMAIEFSGTAGQLNEAFQTQIHRYQVNGVAHLANASDPSVPAALAPVIAGLAPVSDFHPKPNLQVLGQAQFNATTHQVTPQWTYPAGGGVYFLMAPGDFAVQYDINPVYQSGVTGAGQTIAIISGSNVDLSLVQAYQTLFGLPANLPQVIVDGNDPGQTGDAFEAYLDIEIAGSVAPGATVLLYTAADTSLTDGLALAALRAVEDNQASVISTSYGECEQQLGASGNAFWNALWQQAAAQGQTSFVSAGDGGSAGCDDFDTQQIAYDGLQVNGIGSTAYNVSVGGTDLYYSQYAGTSTAINAQLNTYWSASTNSPAVSLQQAVPEQSWNDFFGLNLIDNGNPANMTGEDMIAGGGGASNDALSSNGLGAGYPKPAWQTGTGVPADGVRDLPDLSLFAANGHNYSFYPLCGEPGDCANLTSNGAVVISGVGGTSVSSPSMAAIQALVNQSAGGRQGQANFIYYPLAAKQPSAFHDITIGGNQVLCYPGTTNCSVGSSATNSSGNYVEGGYSAGVGYDLATGLGTVDVANLIKYWNTVAFTPTTATLNVTPVNLVHGQTATISGTVAPSSGSGTPTGSVSLTGNDGITHYASIDSAALASGSFYGQVDNLPGGTYQLVADYGGDSSFAPSKSAPITVTITPENDTISSTGWVLNPSNLNYYQLSNNTTVPYGAQIYLDAQPLSGNATISTQATPSTGTITFTDKLGTATTAATLPLNAAGLAEWSNGIFAPGSHTISETYSGDPSYNPSSASSAATFTVLPGSTSLSVKPLVTSVAAGASVAVDVQLATSYLALYGTLPTGNVSVTLGGQTATGMWQAFGPTGSATLESVVTFNNVSAGMLQVSATYAGDGNWQGSVASGGTVIAQAGKLTPAVTLGSSSANPTPGQSFTLTATVAAASGSATPTGTVLFLSDGQSFDVAASLSKGTATLTIPGYAMANGANLFTAVYQGDGNYNSAASNAVNVTVAQSDFSLTTQNAELTISLSGSGVSTLSLTPINGFSGSVTLAVSTPAGITATPATASLAVGAPVTDALTIGVAASVTPKIYPVTITASGGGHVHTAQILVQVVTVTAPVFTPAGGSYNAVQQVAITDTATGAAIYYTTNGTAPTVNSTLYSGTIRVTGTETIRAIAVAGSGATSSIASATYTLTLPPPFGNLESALDSRTSASPISQSDSVQIAGWVADPTDGSPLSNVKVYIDGTSIGTPTLGIARTDVAAYFKNTAYTNSGFQMIYSTAALSIGTHAVTVIAIDSGGRSTTLGPLTITISGPLPPPFGNLDEAVDNATKSSTIPQSNILLVSGWAADATDGAPLSNVKVYIDGASIGTPTLGIARTDVAAYFKNTAYTNCGFQMTYSVAALSIGAHSVTVIATDSGGRSTTFGPLSIAISAPLPPPFGNLEAALDSRTSSNTISQSDSVLISGWVADAIDGAPLSNVKVYIDGSLIGTPTLGIARSDVAAYFKNTAYTNCGFQLTYSAATLSIGAHAVTVIAADSGGRSTTFGPLTITVSSPLPPPFGNLDAAIDSRTNSSTISQSDSVLISGWVADAIDGAPLSNVKVYIDGSLIGTPTLGIARSDVAAYFKNTAYTNCGFQLTYSAASLSIGTHSVTVIAIDSGGRSTTFGPLSIAISAPLPPPFGNLDEAVDSTTSSTTIPHSDSVLISGWVADAIDGAPLSNVKVYIDGSLIGTPTLGIARSDVAAYFKNTAYTNCGFQLTYSAATLSIGTHAVTVIAIDSGGRSTTFGPLTITVSGT